MRIPVPLASLSKSFAAPSPACWCPRARYAGTATSRLHAGVAVVESKCGAATDRRRTCSAPRRPTPTTYDRDLESNADYNSLVQKLATRRWPEPPANAMPTRTSLQLIGDVVFATTGSSTARPSRAIFKPAGMNDASYGLEGIEASPRWARPHIRAGKGWTSVYPKPTYYRVAPAAGVNASISDMSQWLIAQTGHRPDVLPAPLLATLHAPLIDTPGELRSSSWRRGRLNSAGYGIGWRGTTMRHRCVPWRRGAGLRGMIALVPERDLGVAILWHSDSALPPGCCRPSSIPRSVCRRNAAGVDPYDQSLYVDRASPATGKQAGGAEGSAQTRRPIRPLEPRAAARGASRARSEGHCSLRPAPEPARVVAEPSALANPFRPSIKKLPPPGHAGRFLITAIVSITSSEGCGSIATGAPSATLRGFFSLFFAASWLASLGRFLCLLLGSLLTCACSLAGSLLRSLLSCRRLAAFLCRLLRCLLGGLRTLLRALLSGLAGGLLRRFPCSLLRPFLADFLAASSSWPCYGSPRQWDLR